MNKEKKSVPFLSIGSSSLLVVFLVLCLVIFAVLTLTGAQSDYRFSRQLADRRTAYYAACNQAEEQIAVAGRSRGIETYDGKPQLSGANQRSPGAFRGAFPGRHRRICNLRLADHQHRGLEFHFRFTGNRDFQ